MQKFAANAIIQPHPLGNIMHICPDSLAQIGHLVDIGNLDRQKGIGGIFDQLGCFQTGK